MKHGKVIILSGALVIGSILAVWIANGEKQTAKKSNIHSIFREILAVPTSDFVPKPFHEDVKLIHVGRLKFSIPFGQIKAVTKYDGKNPLILVETSHLQILVSLPVRTPSGNLISKVYAKDLPSSVTHDEVTARAAVLAASGSYADFCLDERQKRELETLLRLKHVISFPNLDKVELFRWNEKNIKGLFYIDKERKHYQCLYYTMDEKVQGTIRFYPKDKNSETEAFIRALVSSVQMDHKDEASTQAPNILISRAIQELLQAK